MRFYIRNVRHRRCIDVTCSYMTQDRPTFWVSSENGKASSIYKCFGHSENLIKRELLELKVDNLCICKIWNF